MVLNRRERAIALIAGGIAAYSIYREEGSLPEGATLFDLILRTAPDDVKPEVTAALIDEVFACVAAHGS